MRTLLLPLLLLALIPFAFADNSTSSAIPTTSNSTITTEDFDIPEDDDELIFTPVTEEDVIGWIEESYFSLELQINDVIQQITTLSVDVIAIDQRVAGLEAQPDVQDVINEHGQIDSIDASNSISIDLEGLTWFTTYKFGVFNGDKQQFCVGSLTTGNSSSYTYYDATCDLEPGEYDFQMNSYVSGMHQEFTVE